MGSREDFSVKTKECVAKRAGYLCSNPICRCATVCASLESGDKFSSIGVAAHICAASKGGKRYDRSMTAAQRTAADNCIWLCQTHAKLIDTDEKRFTAELLRKWKYDAELYAIRLVERQSRFTDSDEELAFKWYDYYRIGEWEVVTGDLLRPRKAVMRSDVYDGFCQANIWLSRNIHLLKSPRLQETMQTFCTVLKSLLKIFRLNAVRASNFYAVEFTSDEKSRFDKKLIWELCFELTKAANAVADEARKRFGGVFNQKINLIYRRSAEEGFKSVVAEYFPFENTAFEFASFILDARKRLF